MPFEPGAALRLLMGCMVFAADVDGLVLWQFCLGVVEKTAKFLMPITLHVSTAHWAVENIEGGKQGGSAMALFSVGYMPARPFFRGRSGCVWLSAWIQLFSSTDRTMAWAFGER